MRRRFHMPSFHCVLFPLRSILWSQRENYAASASPEDISVLERLICFNPPCLCSLLDAQSSALDTWFPFPLLAKDRAPTSGSLPPDFPVSVFLTAGFSKVSSANEVDVGPPGPVSEALLFPQRRRTPLVSRMATSHPPAGRDPLTCVSPPALFSSICLTPSR